MMRRTLFLIAFFVIFVPFFVLAEETQNKAGINRKSINSSEFASFIVDCRISKELSAAITALITNEKPVKKEETAWTYEITSEVMGLPVKAIQIGVCDARGSRDCGWASYLALTIAKPFDEARRKLKKQTGIDYSREKRDREFEVTLRPVLAISKADGETVLYCDPGTL